MKLFDEFTIQKPENQSEHYELYVEGDWNDADYVESNVSIPKDKLENNDFLLYFISYMATGADSHFMEEDPDWDLFEDSDLEYAYMPRGYDANIHSITDVQLNYFDEDGKRYWVDIPRWNGLFKNEQDKVAKVNAAREKFEEGFEKEPSEPLEDEPEMIEFKERVAREVQEDLERMNQEYNEDERD